jgi:hypothetical protein
LHGFDFSLKINEIYEIGRDPYTLEIKCNLYASQKSLSPGVVISNCEKLENENYYTQQKIKNFYGIRFGIAS